MVLLMEATVASSPVPVKGLYLNLFMQLFMTVVLGVSFGAPVLCTLSFCPCVALLEWCLHMILTKPSNDVGIVIDFCA